ncbi:hypothetical protein ACOTBX_24675 [Achromobacter xylosoxidans]
MTNQNNAAQAGSENDIAQRLRDQAGQYEQDPGYMVDAALNRAAADEIERLRREVSRLRAPVADSTLPLEQALHELVDKIVPGLDTGDLVQDARRASTALSAILASAPVATLSAEHFKPPFDNCSFRMCDLPGQCRGEGKCHHPASAPVADERAAFARAITGRDDLEPHQVENVIDANGSRWKTWQDRAALASAPAAITELRIEFTAGGVGYVSIESARAAVLAASRASAPVACNCPGGNKPVDLHAPNCPVRTAKATLVDPYDGGTWLASAPVADSTPAGMKEICPACGHQFGCFHSPYIDKLRASAPVAGKTREAVDYVRGGALNFDAHPDGAPVAGQAAHKAKHDTVHAETEHERVTALAYWLDQQTFEPGMLSIAAATLRAMLTRNAAPQASTVAGEAVYTLRVRGAIQAWTPTAAAFSIPDGEHQLFLSPAAPQASAEAPKLPAGWQLALNLAIDAIENAAPMDWPVNWPAILHGLKELRAALSQPQADKDGGQQCAGDATGRTPTDYALEFAEYLARDVEYAMACLNSSQRANEALLDLTEEVATADAYQAAEDAAARADEAFTEAITALQSAVFEFRKRRDRAALSPTQVAPALATDREQA